MKIKALKEKRAEIFAEMRKLRDKAADENQTWEAVDEERWTDLNKQYDDLTEQISREERFLEIEAQQAQRDRDTRGDTNRDPSLGSVGDNNRDVVVDNAESRAIAMQAWMRSQLDMELTDEQEHVCRSLGVNPKSKNFDVNLRTTPYSAIRAEYRAQSTSATEGGETIPTGFVNNFERALLAFGGMRQVSRVIRTASGNDLHWPTTNDTGNAGAILAENIQVGEQDITTGELVLNAFKYTSKLVRVSQELLEDSAFNMAEALGSMLGERIGRITNTHFTIGTGTGEPQGVTVGGAQGKVAASATAITAEEIIDLVHSVDIAYRSGASIMMHDLTLAAIRKLRDDSGGAGTGQFLWQPGLTAGDPGTILGYRVVVNNDMAQIASTAKTIMFGDFTRYIIRDVAGFRLRRLVERYADFDQEGFVAFSRHDGDVLDAGTGPLKWLEQAV